MKLLEELEALLMYLRTSGADNDYKVRYVQDKLQVLIARERSCSQDLKRSSSES